MTDSPYYTPEEVAAILRDDDIERVRRLMKRGVIGGTVRPYGDHLLVKRDVFAEWLRARECSTAR